jgi:hypothetical protein
MAQMAYQARLAKEAFVRPDLFFVDKLLAQLKQSKPGGAPRPDVIAKQVNSVGDIQELEPLSPIFFASVNHFTLVGPTGLG